MISTHHSRLGGVLPTQDRKCTDIFCALLFIVFTGVSIYAACYGFGKGDLSNIVPPYDSSGNRCGSGVTKDYTFLYFESTSPTNWVDKTACVKSCPISNSSKIECFTNKQVTDCNQLTSRESYSFAKRFCWPKNSAMETATREKFASLGKQEAYGDIVDSWQVFLICAGIAFVIALVYLFILEQCALVLITTVIILFMAGLTFLAYYFHKKYNDLKTDNDPHNDDQKTFLYLAIGVASIEVIFLMCFCCLWSRIKLAARIIEATADYITDVKRLIFIPVIMTVVLIGYLLWWTYAGAYIFSTGHTEHDPKLPWGDVKWTQLTE
jgi:hypothetical protein